MKGSLIIWMWPPLRTGWVFTVELWILHFSHPSMLQTTWIGCLKHTLLNFICDESFIYAKYFGWGKRFPGNLVPCHYLNMEPNMISEWLVERLMDLCFGSCTQQTDCFRKMKTWRCQNSEYSGLHFLQNIVPPALQAPEDIFYGQSALGTRLYF